MAALAHHKPQTTNHKLPALSLGWHLWRRHRMGISLVAGYLAGLIILAHAPALGLASSTIYMLSIPCAFGILYLMGICTHSDADVATLESGYPSYLLVLPVRTRTLVIWPMLYGTLAVSITWMALAEFVIRPRGAALPVFWPAAMLAAMTAILQAIFWSPVPLRYLRLLFVLVGIPGLGVLSAIGLQRGMSSPEMTWMFLAFLPVAFAAALRGVTLARCGESGYSARPFGEGIRSRIAVVDRLLGQVWELLSGSNPARSLPARRLAFQSPQQAQFWYERHRNGGMLPILVAAACIAFSVPLLWIRERVVLDPALLPGWRASVEINAYVKTYLIPLLAAPVLIAATIGSGIRRSEDKRSDRIFTSFLATRPLSDLDLVVPKWKAAAWSCLTAWCILVIFVIVWLLLPARTGTETAPLLCLLLKHATFQSAIAGILFVVLMFAWTWRCQVIGTFATLSNRRWLVYGYPALIHGSYLFALVVGVNWFAVPEAAPTPATFSALAGEFVAVILLLKACATAGIFFTLHRHRLVPAHILIWALVLWTGAVLALWAALHWLFTAGFFSIKIVPEMLCSDRALLAIAALSVPIARLAAAPIAMSWTRRSD
jgi:hypothetical protein